MIAESQRKGRNQNLTLITLIKRIFTDREWLVQTKENYQKASAIGEENLVSEETIEQDRIQKKRPR
jgi:hypothetical protein